MPRNEHESLNVFLVLLLVSLLPNASNSEPLFDWRHVPERISWRTVLTIGGGFALTGVIESVGLSRCLAEQIIKLHFLSPLQTQLVLILLTALLIEINANVVIARLLIPIAADIGRNKENTNNERDTHTAGRYTFTRPRLLHQPPLTTRRRHPAPPRGRRSTHPNFFQQRRGKRLPLRTLGKPF
ncbi:hypothetical protein HPB48_003135 [Haemaphysalis longicornis]|uniref:Citrate transporter-like domain-containing protein n=1 Tax=Haemaphysalis longicornis TaxID=44386 RepID=A0A9J6FAS5_HAELO|nr:hypothetical protein HPB48_003135 [Haemaphysalis longicornis]